VLTRRKSAVVRGHDKLRAPPSSQVRALPQTCRFSSSEFLRVVEDQGRHPPRSLKPYSEGEVKATSWRKRRGVNHMLGGSRYAAGIDAASKLALAVPFGIDQLMACREKDDEIKRDRQAAASVRNAFLSD